MAIAQDRVSWLNHRAHDLAGIKRSGRFSQLRNQCWVEIGAHPITDHIEKGKGIADKVSAARKLIAGGKQDLNLSWTTGHIVGTWGFTNARIGERAFTAHMPVACR